MEKEKEEDVWSRKIIGWQRSRNTLKIGPSSDSTFWNSSNCLISNTGQGQRHVLLLCILLS